MTRFFLFLLIFVSAVVMCLLMLLLFLYWLQVMINWLLLVAFRHITSGKPLAKTRNCIYIQRAVMVSVCRKRDYL